MQIYMKFELFLLELNNLLEKHMLQLTDKIYFMDNTKHYELEHVEDCFLVTCLETKETEKYFTDVVHNIDTDDIVEDYYSDEDDDDHYGFL